MSDYPEHEKLHAVHEQSQAIGEFLDTCGYELCRFREAGCTEDQPRYVWEDGKSRATARIRRGPEEPTEWDYYNDDAAENPVFESWGDGYVPVGKTIPQILAEHFGIDLDKIEAEKRQLLDFQRKANAAARARREAASA